jgi:hypothetical protein
MQPIADVHVQVANFQISADGIDLMLHVNRLIDSANSRKH